MDSAHTTAWDKKVRWLLLEGLVLWGLVLADGKTTRAQPTTQQANQPRVVVSGRHGLQVTTEEVQDVLHSQPATLRQTYRDLDKLRSLVADMTNFELLAREADRRGLASDGAVVRMVRQNAVQQLIQKQFDQNLTPESVSDAQVEEFYQKNLSKYQSPERVRASHILLKDPSKARELLRQLKTAKADAFAELARQWSLDEETKLRGGDLRYFDRQGKSPNPQDPAVDGQIAAAAFVLGDIGELVAKPVKVGDFYSIIKLTARQPGKNRSVDEVAAGIRQDLWRQQRKTAVETFVSELQRHRGVQLHLERLSWVAVK